MKEKRKRNLTSF
jgi:hypothetical protein